MSDVVGALFSIYKFIDGKKGAFKSLEHRFQIFRELEESRAALEDSLNRATAAGGDEQRPLRETLEKATARAQQLAEKMEAAEEQVSQGCPDQCLMSIGCGKQLFQMPEGLLEEINQDFDALEKLNGAISRALETATLVTAQETKEKVQETKEKIQETKAKVQEATEKLERVPATHILHPVAREIWLNSGYRAMERMECKIWITIVSDAVENSDVLSLASPTSKGRTPNLLL